MTKYDLSFRYEFHRKIPTGQGHPRKKAGTVPESFHPIKIYSVPLSSLSHQATVTQNRGLIQNSSPSA